MQHKKNFIITAGYYGMLFAMIFVAGQFLFRYCIPFICAITLLLCLKQPSVWLQSKIHCKMNTAMLLTLTLFYFILFVLIGSGIYFLIQQIVHLFLQLPNWYTSIFQPLLLELLERIELLETTAEWVPSVTLEIQKALVQLSTGMLQGIGAIGKKLPQVLISSLLTIIASYLIAVDYDYIYTWVCQRLPRSIWKLLAQMKGQAFISMRQLCKAQCILAGITWVVSLLLLYGMKEPYALMMASFVALADLIPFIGTGFVFVPWILIKIVLQQTQGALTLLVAYCILAMMRSILEPSVMGTTLKIHPCITLFSLVLGGALFGFLGFILFPFCSIVMVKVYQERSQQIHTSSK